MVMDLKVYNVDVEELTEEGFRPFGDLLSASGPKIDNRDFLKMGFARMSDEVPQSRLDDFDVLDYWGGIATITQEPMRLGYLSPKPRPLVVSWFERHVKGTQSFVPLGGRASILVVAGPSRLDDPSDLPELTSVHAFYLDGSVGVNLHPGTWHWTPFPVFDRADFIILVRTDVRDDDLNFVDLELRLDTKICINYSG